MGEQLRRLDSWKEIAEYLGRDVRTAMRWAKSHGLPVRRVAGGRGRSVFAFTGEIDAWLEGRSADGVEAGAMLAPPPPEPAPRRTLTYAVGATILAATIAIAAGVFKVGGNNPIRVSATTTAVSIVNKNGAEHVVHTFDPGLATFLAKTPVLADIDADGRSDILFGVAYYEDVAQRNVRSGELLNIAADGAVRWRFAFDDRLPFRDGTFTGPWGLTDWQVGPAASPARIAVAAHDNVWWGSMAAVIDHTGRRISTFVNPGWIESLLWLDRDRLAAAGFSNARNGAMLAIVNPNRALTQAPGSEGTPFQCTACPADAPLFYATFPRSELNVLTAGRFNRAQVAWADDRLQVTTIEIAGDPLAATALYEFDRDLRLLRARYGDVYWDAHRRLELEGRVTHSREDCPGRDGPPAIDVWSGTEWTRLTAPMRPRNESTGLAQR